MRADEEAGQRCERIHELSTAARRVPGAEDAGGCEHAHEATKAGDLGWVELHRRHYVGDGGGAGMVVDGIGNTEVQSGFERHGLDVGKGGVPELELSVEQSLVSACGESHGARYRCCFPL